jgi:hypothetical protein
MFSTRRGGQLIVALTLAIPLLCLHTAPVVAQAACAVPTVNDATAAVRGIDDLLLSDCLGGKSCQTDECKLVAKLENPDAGAKPSQQQISDQILIVLRKLHDRARTLDEGKLGVAQLHGMLARWHIPSLGDTREESIVVPTRLDNREWQGSQFDLFLHTPFELNLEKAFQADSCRTAQQCDASFKSAVEVYTLSALVHRALERSVLDDIAAIGNMLKVYDARWTAFHTKSRAVFPWELIVNNLSYKSASEGFSGPPNWQWLFLHPSAAVAYDDKQDDKMQEALLLDVVGRYRWTWGGKNDAEITHAWGAALAMSWTGDDPGYGVAIHLPQNWSIGVTRSKDDQTQILLSVEFAQFVTDKRKNVDSFRKQLEDWRFHQ